jgi:serine/threonine-protein kinase
MISGASSARQQGSATHVGRLLKEKWRLDTLLGVGGVASVYAATHRNRNRVAVKILNPVLAADPDLRSRFLNEGYAANAVGHAGAVQVLDDDVTDDGLVFLVMELLEGETLHQRATRLGGRLPLPDVLWITDALLAVLTAAHEKQIVHRDLKPDNLFLTTDGVLKVLDFGIARLQERPSDSLQTGTRFGATMGTPGYMSPEQVQGRWNAVDARSDLWAVGATMFMLLSGRAVHVDESGAPSLYLAATQPAPSLATVTTDLPLAAISLVDRALMVDRDARWSSSAEMREAVNAVRATPPGSMAPLIGARSHTLPDEVSGFRLTAPQARSAVPAPTSAQVLDNMAPVEFARDTYWIGKRDPRSIFHVNPYLRVFRRPGGGADDAYNLIIDPGSSSDFAVVSAKLGTVIGGPGRLSGMFINHQDPDVGSSAAVISARYAPKASIFCSEATFRLIVHFNLPRDRFVDTDKLARGIPIPTGHVVIPVPTPFCHFRGAVMLYDPETRVLFSGDLFGGLTAPGARGIWADETDWSGMRAFHQTYMPTQRVLASAVRAIRRLDPPVEIIAPQHGRLLRGPLLAKMLDRLEKLPVGLDILDDVGEGADVMIAWSSVLRRVLHTASLVLDTDIEAILSATDELHETIKLDGGPPEVLSAGRWTIGKVVSLLTDGKAPTIANPIKLEAAIACDDLELPSPDLHIESEEDAERMGGISSR